MKSFFLRNKEKILVFLYVLITVSIFYSGNLSQEISEIETDYVIDTNTLNNSFITLGIKAGFQDVKTFQEIREDLKKQMVRFNERYAKNEPERQAKKNIKLWVDRITYALLFLQIMFIASTTGVRTDVA